MTDDRLTTEQIEELLELEGRNLLRPILEELLQLRAAVEAADKFITRYCEAFQISEAHKGKFIEDFQKALRVLRGEK